MATEFVERMARLLCVYSFDGYDPDEIVTHKPPPEEFQNVESLGNDELKDEYWIDDPKRADEVIYAWKKWRLYVPQALVVIEQFRVQDQ